MPVLVHSPGTEPSRKPNTSDGVDDRVEVEGGVFGDDERNGSRIVKPRIGNMVRM